ncbi:MAG: hypothetical protein E5V52_06140, partial [Mesorhizobium sp.]
MRIEGIPASPGYAEGPLFDLDQPPVSYKAKASAGEEQAALVSAIGKAVGRLAVLAATADGEAAGILEFHIAMLEDDALSGPALAVGEGGGRLAEGFDLGRRRGENDRAMLGIEQRVARARCGQGAETDDHRHAERARQH